MSSHVMRPSSTVKDYARVCSETINAFSGLHYVIKVTLQYLVLHRFKIYSALELSRTDLLRCRLAASLLREVARWQ